CAGETARSHMISADWWNISDGGKRCATATPTATATTACVAKPVKPTYLRPRNNAVAAKPKVKLNWNDMPCATSYKVTVKNTVTGLAVFKRTITNPLVSKTKTGVLPAGHYKWFVKACNTFGCNKSIKLF